MKLKAILLSAFLTLFCVSGMAFAGNVTISATLTPQPPAGSLNVEGGGIITETITNLGSAWNVIILQGTSIYNHELGGFIYRSGAGARAALIEAGEFAVTTEFQGTAWVQVKMDESGNLLIQNWGSCILAYLLLS